MKACAKYTFLMLMIACCLPVSCVSGSGKGSETESSEIAQAEVFPMGFNPKAFESVDGRVRSGETFPGLFVRYGLSPSRAQELTNYCHSSGIFDMRKLRADARVTAYYKIDPVDSTRSLSYMVYENDRIHSTVFSLADTLLAVPYEKPTHQERKIADVSIRTSLWNDMLSSGISPLLIVELADIYAWTINFFGLQKDDRFRAVYTQTVCDGEVVSVDSVLFCIYNSGDFQSSAVRFDQKDGRNKYWNEKGESMRKAFLKAPLKFNRISSGFTYHRKHPVSGKVKAHTAVDYAAPKGTHVHSIGDGTVTLCGWDPSGGGNRIKIRHMNGYETSYMHLSGFAKGIRAGSRVAQGQLIGYVGSTGTSTGPHLDFRVWKDKTPVNPLKMIAPPSEPLKAENLDSLRVLVGKYSEELSDAGE